MLTRLAFFLRKKKTPSPREHWEFFFCLHRAGIETIGKLTDTTVADLKRIRNLGQKCLDEIIEKLAEKELTLLEEEAEP